MELIITTRSELQNLVESAVSKAVEGLNMKQEVSDKYFNSDELCSYLGIASSTLSIWKRENKIPFSRLGKRVVFCKQKIDEWVKRNENFEEKV